MAQSGSSSITSSPNTTNITTMNSPNKTMRPQPKKKSNGIWSKVERLFSYVWLLIQILLLLAGLTVLNFAILMVVLSYCIYGYFVRREFLSYKLD